MEVPTLPDPQDTAKKISQFLVKGSGMALDGSAPGMHGQTAMASASDMKYDMIKEAYRTERDIKRALEDVGEIEGPQDVVRALEEARSEFRDRDAEEIAGGLTELGGNATKDEVKAFVNDSIDTLQKLVSSQDMEPMAMEVEHAAEEEAMLIEKEIM